MVKQRLDEVGQLMWPKTEDYLDLMVYELCIFGPDRVVAALQATVFCGAILCCLLLNQTGDLSYVFPPRPGERVRSH
jgi:hypothetical protein